MRLQSTVGEEAAFDVVRAVLKGAKIDDSPEKEGPGRVDAHIVRRDQPIAALEVTTLANKRERELESLLEKDEFLWQFPGLASRWNVTIPPNTDLRELKSRLPGILRECEAAGVFDETNMWRLSRDSPDVRWLVTSGVLTHGDPETTGDTDRCRPGDVQVFPKGKGGATSIAEVPGWLSEQLATNDLLRGKARKLAASGQQKRHLFIVVDHGGAPFSSFHALAFGEDIPTDPPLLGEDVTHLWLAPRWSATVLTWWAAAGWQRHRPYG